MFFDIALLCPQSNGKFAVIWIAATRGITKLSKKQILNVDVAHICAEISSMCINQSQKPRERLSLSLSARLANGVIKILFQQTRILQRISSFPVFDSTYDFISLQKKRVQKKIKTRNVPSVEIELQQPVRTEAVDNINELNITDQDVEAALRQQPTTLIDSITLREEMPSRAVAQDEDNFFGDERLTLKERMEFERSWQKDMPQVRSQTEIEPSQEVQLEKEQLPIQLAIEEPTREQGQAAEQLQEKEQVVERPQEQIEELPQTPKRGLPERTPRAVAESPAKRKRLIRALEPELAPEIRTLHPKLLLKVNTRLKKIQVRCEDTDYDMWTARTYDIDPQTYKTLLKEFQDFFAALTGRGPSAELAEELQPTDSRGTDSRVTVRRVTGDTPIAGKQSQQGISPQDVQKRPDDEIRMTRQRKQLSGKKSSLPEVEIPKISPAAASDIDVTPVTTRTAIPLTTHDTVSVIEGVTERETIIEDLPPAAKTAYGRIVVDTIPEAAVRKEKALKFIQRYEVNRCVGAYEIRDFELTRCENTEDDPITLENVTISLGNEVSPIVSGVFMTTIDLYPPIKISTVMEKKIIWWIIMPCINNMGSCTFSDICRYGTPANDTCPAVFQNLPCRCPVKKGTYTIPPRISSIFEESLIVTGFYKGTITISSNGTRLACYDTSFQIYST
ncbi:gm2 ganglioside activator protein [Holotrichia oblita]|uniref:Gm2 ganglioside activator protein n=1 Tax=Holotrichia oblita TaxID=644536 RepID=A0ACB9T7B4_HOLOL|nr:gm2 ganglioside activator protein [Holotrichia oblita]